MKTMIAVLTLAILLPVSALADELDLDVSGTMSNEEAREIAKSPEYAELRHSGASDRDSVAPGDELPRTASPLPLLALLGASSLGAAVGIRRAAR